MQRPESITHLPTIDLLAMLLGSRRSAHALLHEAKGSLFNLLHRPPEPSGSLLCAQERGAYEDKHITRLHVARELAARALAEQLAHRDALTSPEAVRAFLIHSLGGLKREVFVVLYLDAMHRVITTEELFKGDLTETACYPRQVAVSALSHGAAALIVAHNHPSGQPQPSRADEVLTQGLKETMKVFNIKLLDHFIVAGNQAMSFAERGLL